MSALTPEAVAAKLSVKQRACLLNMTGDYQRAKEIPAAAPTLHSLWDFGRDFSTTESACAAPTMLVHREPEDHPLGYVWQLTGEGRAVKALLQADPQP